MHISLDHMRILQLFDGVRYPYCLQRVHPCYCNSLNEFVNASCNKGLDTEHKHLDSFLQPGKVHTDIGLN